MSTKPLRIRPKHYGNIPASEEFGKRLMKARIDKRMSQQDLALAAGLSSHTVISLAESGRKGMRLFTVATIENILGCKLTEGTKSITFTEKMLDEMNPDDRKRIERIYKDAIKEE